MNTRAQWHDALCKSFRTFDPEHEPLDPDDPRWGLEGAIRNMELLHHNYGVPLPPMPASDSNITDEDRGNRRVKGRRVKDMMQAAPRARGRDIPNFPLLSEAIGGLRAITVVGGITKHGKSRLVANIVANVGGPEMPVLYLDRENDDQADDQGPLTRTIGDWIEEGYGSSCPALDHLLGYYKFEALEEDVQTLKPPFLIVIDTVQSIVAKQGDQTRTAMNALVDWAKDQVRRGCLVILVSQLNAQDGFKESRGLEEGTWTSLKVTKVKPEGWTGALNQCPLTKVRVQLSDVRHHGPSSTGVEMLVEKNATRFVELSPFGVQSDGAPTGAQSENQRRGLHAPVSGKAKKTRSLAEQVAQAKAQLPHATAGEIARLLKARHTSVCRIISRL